MSKNKSGHRIRVARNIHKPRLTQDDLVAKLQIMGLDISKNIISRIEIGDWYVTDLELAAIAAALNVSTSWLLEETDIPNKK